MQYAPSSVQVGQQHMYTGMHTALQPTCVLGFAKRMYSRAHTPIQQRGITACEWPARPHIWRCSMHASAYVRMI